MFVSFFPRPKLFFWSAVAWTALAMAVWYGFAGEFFRRPKSRSSAWPPSQPRRCCGLTFITWFASRFSRALWMWFAPHPWARWSILGSALIIFTSYFQVQVSVAINALVWAVLRHDPGRPFKVPRRSHTKEVYDGHLATFIGIAMVAVDCRRPDAVLR